MRSAIVPSPRAPRPPRSLATGRGLPPAWSTGVEPRPVSGAQPPAARRLPLAADAAPAADGRPSEPIAAGAPADLHPLTDRAANARLAAYEDRVQGAFERIEPALREIARAQREVDFGAEAQRIAEARLGFRLPEHLLADAWVRGPDLSRLFAWCTFETYLRVSREFYAGDPLGGRTDDGFDAFLQSCGFHALDITPCADGRLAHAVSYVLRLPYGLVERKSYAGALFSIEDRVTRWVTTELRRFREGWPNTADAPTRYLKALIYHYSSVDPAHQGCLAHGSDAGAAARAGWERLCAFRQAIENSWCCGASVDLLLIGLDTDTDAIRVHVPDARGDIDLDRWLAADKVYDITRGLPVDAARVRIAELVRAHAPQGGTDAGPPAGMVALIARLFEHNISQLDLVRGGLGGRWREAGHAERFIGVGVGFDDIQLRNLTYFAHLHTVEEGAADLDVGLRIFTGLNLRRGLPVPVVVRQDYHGGVPGARERAVAHCERIAAALAARWSRLCDDGLLACLRAVRDCDGDGPLEVVGSSLDPDHGAH